MSTLPPINLGRFSKDGKASKFRLPYSRTPDFQLPEFIPKEKRKGELTVGMYLGMTLMTAGRNIEGVLLNVDDSHKQADVIIMENGRKTTVQITRLTITQYERRKDHCQRKSIEFARNIQTRIALDFPIIVSMFPKNKHEVPLDSLKIRRRENIEKMALDFVVDAIVKNFDILKAGGQNVRLDRLSSVLSEFYDGMDLCPVPDGRYSNVPGQGNVFINYKFYDSTYDSGDIEKEIGKIYTSKNGGKSDLLLIWANRHELLNEKKVVESLRAKFSVTTFKEIFFACFGLDSRVYVIR